MNKQNEDSEVRLVCRNCCELVNTTLCKRTIPFDDGSGEVENIQIYACSICNQSLAVHPQSVPKIQDEYKKTHH